jgi:hypothetical protein
VRNACTIAAALACGILFWACPARKPETRMNAAPHAMPARHLPWEPRSGSELLAASHIFAFTVAKRAASAWRPDAGGLERRELELVLRLDATLKGGLAAPEGGTFPFRTAQIREPGGMVSDYHGFWSHFEPAEGGSYLALASGAATDPALLLSEPAIKSVLPALRRKDLEFAEAAEARLPPPTADTAAREAAFAGIARDLMPRRAELGTLAAAYVMARTGEGDLRGGPVADALLEVILDPGTGSDLRILLATGLCSGAMDQGAAPAQRTALARAFFKLAKLPQAHPALEQMAAGELFNLVFADEAPDLKASEVIPDGPERDDAAALLQGFEEERAEALAAWLKRG